MNIRKINEVLKLREFISIATCDFKGRPHAAPKFILKAENNFIYLVDYSIGRTWENLKVNPTAALSLMDTDNLMGYQIDGSVEMIDKGAEYDKIMCELRRREIDLSIKRIIEGVHTGKKHESFEVVLPEHVVVYKVKIEEIIEIAFRGELKKEKL